MDKNVKSIIKSAYHRNGIAGTGFYVALFNDADGDKKLAILFPEAGSCAILSMELLAKDVIEFTQNSWRGDHFEDELRKELEGNP